MRRTARSRPKGRRHCASWPARDKKASGADELVLEPAPHGGAAEREIVALAVLGAAFLAREHAQRLVLRPTSVVERLRILERNLLVVLAVHDQERAAHLLHDAVEPERLQLLECVIEGVGAENPHDVMAGHRERSLELRLDAPLPYRVIVPDRAPGDASGKARLERGATRRVVTAEADGDDADPLGVDVRPFLQEIDAGAARL